MRIWTFCLLESCFLTFFHRSFYPTDQSKSAEMLTSLLKVCFPNLSNIFQVSMFISQSSDTTNYNAWDEDIAMVKVQLNYFIVFITLSSQPFQIFFGKGSMSEYRRYILMVHCLLLIISYYQICLSHLGWLLFSDGGAVRPLPRIQVGTTFSTT